MPDEHFDLSALPGFGQFKASAIEADKTLQSAASGWSLQAYRLFYGTVEETLEKLGASTANAKLFTLQQPRGGWLETTILKNQIPVAMVKGEFLQDKESLGLNFNVTVSYFE